jgi:hypothetical protein
MRRPQRPILTLAALLAALSLASCESTDMLDKLVGAIPDFNAKKKLPGERKELFPEGVPGVPQGVPPEMVKGNQAAAAAAAEAAPAPEPAPPPKAEKPKPKKRVQAQSRPAGSDDVAAQGQNDAWGAPPPRQQSGAWGAPPPQQQPDPSAWPAPPGKY